jgi:hypothetical protein
VEPPELEPYLESKLEWREVDFAWDWENWRDDDGTLIQPETGVVYGLTVRTADARLVSMLRSAYEGETRELPGYGYTFVIAGLGGGGSGATPIDPDPQPTPPGQNGGGALDPVGAVATLALAWGAAARLRGRG